MYSHQTKTMTRQEMYDMVWSKPMIELSKQFQLSDNGLRKICKKYDIPMPRGGYWQKLHVGKNARKRLLPNRDNKGVISINIKPLILQPEPSLKLAETIHVPLHIAKLHPLIEQTQKRFKQRAQDRGRLVVQPGCLDIRVGAEMVPRACRIMDTIIKVIERYGGAVVIDRKGSTNANIDGEMVSFNLEESLRIIKTPGGLFGERQEFVPNGKLVLRIKDHPSDCRSKWSDGKGKLEEKVLSFFNGLWSAAAYIKKSREDRENEERKKEQESEKREKQLILLQKEKCRLQVLEQQAASWQKSRMLRSFIRAAIKKHGTYKPDSEFAKWVSWATNYANGFDPLK